MAPIEDKTAHTSAGSNSGSNDHSFIEALEEKVPGYAHDRDNEVARTLEEEEANNPNIHHKMSFQLFMSLAAMSFLWVGSQIPLYMLGSVIPLIYNDIGGYEIYVWLIIGYLIPNAALCPFVGALSDLIGRKPVAAIGQVLLVIGPIVTVTAHDMLTAIGGMILSGLGAGLNELIALAGTAELVPVRKRGTYVGMVVFTILPFCPSVLWAQLIAQESNWRYVGIPVGVWNFIGLLLILFTYKDPARHYEVDKKKVLREIDYIGGLLSTIGVTLFMMGMQWGAQQYE